MNYENDELERARGRSRRRPAAQSAGSKRRDYDGDDISRALSSENRRSKIDQLRKQQAKKKRTRRRIIAMIVAECFALMGIFGYAYFARRLTMMPRPSVEKSNVENENLQLETLQKMEGYWMIAVFGVDSRNGSVGAGNQSDVNMICCINQDTGEIRLVSVFRDTYLNTSDEGRYSKFNEAYARGGPEQALKFLNKNLDLNITDYITFSWKAVADGINILGGVDLELSKAEFKYINGFITETVNATGVGSHQLKSAGMNHLDGVQAVAYGRLRLMDTDYARTERQRKIIELAFAKAKQADYAVLNNILVTILPQVSHNLDFADLTNVALSISKYHIGETAGFPSARTSAVLGSKGDCVIPLTLESNVVELHQFLFGDEAYEPTDTVKQISAKISSDTGMYTQGKSIGHVSTEGYLPKETKAPVETSPAETTEGESESEVETDEYGNPIEPTSGDGTVIHPGIGETDEFGNLVDGPETEDPDDPLYWPQYPGDQPGNYPGDQPGTYPGDQPSQPYKPSSPGEQYDPDRWTGPGVTGNGNGPGNGPGTGTGTSSGNGGGTSDNNGTGTGDNNGTGTGNGTGNSQIPYPGYQPENSTSGSNGGGPGSLGSSEPGGGPASGSGDTPAGPGTTGHPSENPSTGVSNDNTSVILDMREQLESREGQTGPGGN